MNKKTKIIFSYILLFIESIMLFIITILLASKCTILNTKYIKNTLEKNNYYQEIYKEILTEMSYYTNQSGFEDSVLDNTFTIGEIKYEINSFVDNTYGGKKTSIDTTKLEERLRKNINNFINSSSFKIVDEEEINKFIKTIGTVYQDEIKLMGYSDKGLGVLTKINNLSNKLIIVLSILTILLIIINKQLFERLDLSIVLYTSSFLLIFINYYIKNNIDIKNIFIYSPLISKITKDIITSYFNNFIAISIAFLFLGIVLELLKKIKKS